MSSETWIQEPHAAGGKAPPARMRDGEVATRRKGAGAVADYADGRPRLPSRSVNNVVNFCLAKSSHQASMRWGNRQRNDDSVVCQVSRPPQTLAELSNLSSATSLAALHQAP